MFGSLTSVRDVAVSDDAGFLKAMAANPTDTLIPLVYADWFDERNDPRGRLLRVWVDLSWRASHAGHGFRDLLREFQRLLSATDPDWRREFGAHRPWIDGNLAVELVRGWMWHVEQRPPAQRGIRSSSGSWFSDGPDVRGWLVSYWTGRWQRGYWRREDESVWLVFVKSELGWVYSVPTCGPNGWFQRFDLGVGEGSAF